MFEKNDYVMYGTAGVCLVQKVDYADFMNEKKRYYFLKPLHSMCDRIFVPVDGGAPMRKVLTKSEADELIAKMPSMETDWLEDDNAREKAYREALQKFDCYELAKMAKCLYRKVAERKNEGKKPLQMDEKYLNTAEEYLFGELAVALEIPVDGVVPYITGKVRGFRTV